MNRVYTRNTPSPSDLLTVAEALELLHRKQAWFYQQRKANAIAPSAKYGKQMLYARADVLRLREAHTVRF